MANVSTRTLQVRLLLLVLLAFLPALGFFWFVNGELRELHTAALEEELVQRARDVAVKYETLIDQSSEYLATLAEFPEVGAGRAPVCGEYLNRSIRHMRAYTTLSMVGMDGYLVCGAVAPESGLYLGDRAYFLRASTRNAFAVGEFALGRISGMPVVGVALPISDDSGMRRVLAASVNLNILADHAALTPLPQGFTFTVMNRDKRVMVRLPRTGDFTLADSVGAVAGPQFPDLPTSAEPVLVGGVDMDGMARLFAVARLGPPGEEPQGYLAFGRNQVTLSEEVDAIVDLELRYLAGGAFLLLLLAWALGHFWVARCPEEQEVGQKGP